MDAGSAITVVTTGMLPMLLLAAAALTAPTALFLLWLYRRAVIGQMSGTALHTTPQPAGMPGARVDSVPPLRVRYLDATEAWRGCVLYRRMRRSLLGVGVIHGAAGAAYASVFASAWMVLSGGDAFVWSRFLWLVACYAWPATLAVGIACLPSRGERLSLAAGYFLLIALVAGYVIARNPTLSVGSLVFFWIYANGAPSVLFVTFLQRRVRAVGPLVLAFMVAAVTGSQVVLSLVGASDRSLHTAVDVGAGLGLGGTGTFFMLLLLGFALFAGVGWWGLQRLGERYRRRRTSDQVLMLDAMWLLFGIVQSITLSFEGWAWLFMGLAGFAAVRIVAGAGFRLLRGRSDEAGVTLLLLRVFSLGRRSEQLFHAASKAWLRSGSITLIAGPDLVASTVEPHEFLEFVGGRLSRQFVRDATDLERRIGAMARGPDPDGRYRVNEFFCHADTWQPTMRRLAATADAVLMDLRSFGPDKQGCLYEIEQLLAGVDLSRVLLVVDRTTDRAFLDAALQGAWQRVGGNACGAELRVMQLEGQSGRELRVLLCLLLAGRGAPMAAVERSAVPT